MLTLENRVNGALVTVTYARNVGASCSPDSGVALYSCIHSDVESGKSWHFNVEHRREDGIDALISAVYAALAITKQQASDE